MGASWRRGSAAALLLALAAALALPSASAGTAAAPELSDPAGDQEVDTGSVPVVPGVNDEAFDDVDVVAGWLEERGHDCVGATAATCPAVHLVVATTAGWTTGTMTITFAVKRGPTSLPASTATDAGTQFTLTVAGTAVSGLANATAASGPEGLRITMPLSPLGATGGDLLADLGIATTRTDAGTLQGVEQDDQTGTDTAGPGTAYTFTRPAVAPRLVLDVVSMDGKAGAVTVTGEDADVPVVLRVTNLGLDADAWQLSFQSAPPLQDPPVFAQAFTPIAAGATAETTVTLSLAGMDEGAIALTFAATSERGASTTARATLTLDLPSAAPPGEREVKPEGLAFLTAAAEGVGFDGPFGPYAEIALLALLVLLVLLALYLVLALGRTTMDNEPATEAPWPAGAPAAVGAAGPGGVIETVHAGEAPPALFAATASEAEAAVDAMPDVDPAALAAALAVPEGTKDQASASAAADAGPLPAASGAASPRIRIEEVRHTPREPDAGEGVTTEVLLRNDGPTATLRVALSLDGKPAAERTVQVPAHATKAVELPWTAGPGDNRVKISAYPA